MCSAGYTFRSSCEQIRVVENLDPSSAARPFCPLLVARKMGFGYLIILFYHKVIETDSAFYVRWFFGDFRCGVRLFIVILVIYKYKNR